MANFIYSKAKQAMLSGDIDLGSTNLKVAFIKTALYTPNQNTHEFLSDIATAAKVYRSSALQNVSNTLGVLDADDISINYDGSAFEAIALYQYGTSDSDSRLIAFIDTSEGLPFPGTLDASALLLKWNDTSTKIISL
jgi:hypothetical protein